MKTVEVQDDTYYKLLTLAERQRIEPGQVIDIAVKRQFVKPRPQPKPEKPEKPEPPEVSEEESIELPERPKNVSYPSKKQRANELWKRQAIKAKAEGWTTAEMSVAFNKSAQTIRDFLRSARKESEYVRDENV